MANVVTVSREPLVPFDPGKPNAARIGDYALGGKDNFAADRDLAQQMLEIVPLGPVLARENRDFLARAVDCVSRNGVFQFIDVGSGLPTSPNTHEMAGRADPAARVVYVDNDPVVISHAAALLTGSGNAAAVPGDVRHPEAILASAELTETINLRKPVCVIMAMVLDYVEPAQAADIVATFGRAMTAGSFLIISIGANNNAPDLAERVIETWTAGLLHLHGREQVAGYFAGFDLVEPGLTEARRWRRLHAAAGADERPADILVGVGRKAG